jgi:hypothetical protein
LIACLCELCVSARDNLEKIKRGETAPPSAAARITVTSISGSSRGNEAPLNPPSLPLRSSVKNPALEKVLMPQNRPQLQMQHFARERLLQKIGLGSRNSLPHHGVIRVTGNK